MPSSSPFYQNPPPRPPKRTPGTEGTGRAPSEQLAQKQLKDGPTRSELEGWYRDLQGILDDDGIAEDSAEGLRDLRDAIYRYLY